MNLTKLNVTVGFLTFIVAASLFWWCARVWDTSSWRWLPYVAFFVPWIPYWTWLEALHRSKEKRLASGLEKLAHGVSNYLSAPAIENLEQAYITGKVVPVNRLSNIPELAGPATIHLEIYSRLADNLRACSDEEVGTIVWLDWLRRTAHDREGYPQTIGLCTITVIDRNRSMVVGKAALHVKDTHNRVPMIGEFGMAIEGPPLGWYYNLCEGVLSYVAKLPKT